MINTVKESGSTQKRRKARVVPEKGQHSAVGANVKKKSSKQKHSLFNKTIKQKSITKKPVLDTHDKIVEVKEQVQPVTDSTNKLQRWKNGCHLSSTSTLSRLSSMTCATDYHGLDEDISFNREILDFFSDSDTSDLIPSVLRLAAVENNNEVVNESLASAEESVSVEEQKEETPVVSEQPVLPTAKKVDKYETQESDDAWDDFQMI